ncbi:PQQ-dependent sugar dehydrogenase [Sphingomonas sp. SFZ2018-12]|uniref:PQQ-dependent sugar dehydrogenase n=1 Tax=Sphingomonas sp. SFZ2018-12 TaxID=2683197 RepID=UPI001F0EF2E5|nr:PQQ-dependent sugar dehydrogenase [Sphingomonas sp. SFZ2018-12]MCH4891589.1 PQQ-dependent sugar dehydrogenase [Sphingomonas sp. SFZ2018-12]
MRAVQFPIAAILIAALGGACQAQPTPQDAATAAGLPFAVTPVADFTAPWAMTFLPDGRMLVTEKAGQLMLVSADGKTKSVVATVPGVSSEGQGGLMDVVLHPDFATNRIVYLSYSTPGEGGKGVVLARGKLTEGAAPTLEGLTTIFTATPFVAGEGHYSGRIAFSPDGKYLFFTNGERQKFDPAQDPKATLGKVLRLTPDGKPAGDPALTAKGFHPAIWSYGHRNLLGIAFDAQGNLWEQEMGPKGGDEVNVIVAGRNYGYPIVSDGDHYDGRDIPDHDTRPEFEAPKVSWNPVISPGGLIVYSGKMFPQWQGDLFIGGLSSKALVRVDVDGTNARKGDQWDMGARIREVEQGPDGAIYVLEDGRGDSQGRLLKLTPR